MEKSKLKIEDLKIDPQDLRDLADQLQQPPPRKRSGWRRPRVKLRNGVYLEGNWKDGPTVDLVIEIP